MEIERELLGDLRRFLREIEWVSDDDSWLSFCPACGSRPQFWLPEKGHAPDCTLTAMIARIVAAVGDGE